MAVSGGRLKQRSQATDVVDGMAHGRVAVREALLEQHGLAGAHLWGPPIGVELAREMGLFDDQLAK